MIKQEHADCHLNEHYSDEANVHTRRSHSNCPSLSSQCSPIFFGKR